MPSSSEMAQVLAGGAGKTGAPAAATAPSAPGAAPNGAPSITPQPNEGQQQQAQIWISMATDLLERALAPYGSETEQGKAILTALQTISKVFGATRDKAKPLVAAELMSMMKALPQAGGATPESMATQGAGGPAPTQQQPMAA